MRIWLEEQAGTLLRVAVGGAVLLMLTYPTSKLADDIITEDPTGYRLLTLCGLAAAAALAVGAWREEGRIATAAALAAAVPFAFASYAVGSYWFSVVWGAMGSPSYQPFPLLPFFAVVAVVGATCALALAAAWWL